MPDGSPDAHRHRDVRRRFGKRLVVPHHRSYRQRRRDRASIEPGRESVGAVFRQQGLKVREPDGTAPFVAEIDHAKLEPAFDRPSHQAPRKMIEQLVVHMEEQVLPRRAAQPISEDERVTGAIIHVADGFFVATVHTEVPVGWADDRNRIGPVMDIRIVHEPVVAPIFKPGPHAIAYSPRPLLRLRVFAEQSQRADARGAGTHHVPVAAWDLMTRNA